MIPMFGGTAGWAYLNARVCRLEQELDATLGLLQILAERMRQTLGAEALGPELCRFLSTFDEAEQREFITRLDDLTKSAVKPEAVRRIRSLTSVTWDQAERMYADWRSFSKCDKERWVRAFLVQKATQPQEGTKENA